MQSQAMKILFIISVFALVLFTMWHSRLYRPAMDRVLIMDTVVVVSYPSVMRKKVSNIIIYMQRLSNMLDYYNKNSCVSRLNKNGRVSSSDKCFPLLFNLIKKSRQVWIDSGYAFDPGYVKKIPIGKVILKGNLIELAPGQVLDFSGIAKGFIVDKAVKKAIKEGFPYIWINAGGEVRTYSEEGSNLLVGIRDPLHKKKAFAHIYLKNESVATSGTYERGTHIINPSGNILPSGLVSASVIAKECAIADAFATALMIKGKPFLSELAERGMPAMCIYIKDGRPKEEANKLWKEKQV